MPYTWQVVPERLHAVQQRQAAVVQRGVVCSSLARLPLYACTCACPQSRLTSQKHNRLPCSSVL